MYIKLYHYSNLKLAAIEAGITIIRGYPCKNANATFVQAIGSGDIFLELAERLWPMNYLSVHKPKKIDEKKRFETASYE